MKIKNIEVLVEFLNENLKYKIKTLYNGELDQKDAEYWLNETSKESMGDLETNQNLTLRSYETKSGKEETIQFTLEHDDESDEFVYIF